MADNEEIVQLIIDAKNLSSDELNQVSEDVERLGKVADAAEKQLNKLKIEQDTIQSFNQLQTEVKELKTNISAAELAMDKSKTALKANTKATAEDRQAIRDQNAALKLQRSELTKKNTALNKSKAAIKTLGVAQKNAVAVEKEYSARINKTQQEIKESVLVYKTEAATLKEIYLEKKKVIDQSAQETAAAKKVADVHKKSAADRNDQLNRQIKDIKRKAAAQKAADAADKNAALAADKITSKLKTYEAELSKLHAELKKGTITKAQYIKGEAALRNQLKLTEKQVKVSNAALAADNMSKRTRSTDLLTKATRRLAQAYTVFIAAQKATQAITSSVKGYGELEAAQIKVQKTTDLARDEVVKMSKELQALATEITPTATNELLKYAEVAGQLGVEGSDSILQMVAAADALNVSTDLAGDEAATLLTRILTMTKEGVPAIDALASVVVELGNTTATTESEIVQMTKEIVTGTTAIGLGSTAAAAYGATLKELGQTGERSRSAFIRLSATIQNAVLNGGAELEQLALITGQTAAELEENLGERPEKILNDFIAGLARVKDEGGTAQNTLKAFGITANESISVFDALANNVDRLERNIKNVGTASEAANRHILEAAKAYASQESTLSRLVNKFTELQTKIGEAYSDETDEAVREFSRIIDENAEAVTQMMEYLVEAGRDILELGISVNQIVGSFTNFGNEISFVSIAVDGFRTGMNLILGTLQLAAAGFLEWRIQLGEFLNWWSTSGKQFDKNITNMREAQANLFKGASEDFKDAEDAISDFNGVSSDAYRDVLNNANKYAEGVSRLSDEQKKQLESIIKSGKFNKELQEIYRELTVSIVANNREIEIEGKLSEQAAKRREVTYQQQSELLVEIESMLQLVKTGESTLNEIRLQADKDLKEKIITETEYREQLTAVEIAEQRVAAATEAARLKVENSNNTYLNASDAVIGLKDDIAKLKLTLEKAKSTMAESTEGNILYEQASRDAATATRDLAEAQRTLVFSQELESATKFKVEQLNRKNEASISSLKAAYDAGRVKVGEYKKEMGELIARQSLLKGVTDNLTKSIKTNTDKVDGNTESVKDNTDALQENVDLIDEVVEAENKATVAVSAHVNAQLALRKQYDFTALSMEELTKQYDTMEKGVRKLSLGSAEWFGDLNSMTNAASQHKRETVGQTIAMRNLLDQVQEGSLTLNELNDATNRATTGFNKLGDQQLEPLRRAIDTARKEFERLDDSINRTLDRTQDRLDKLLGKEGDILARRFKQEMLDGQKLLDEATASGDSDAIKKARENLITLGKIHTIETKNFKDEKKQREADRIEEVKEEKIRLAEEKKTLRDDAKISTTPPTPTILGGGQVTGAAAGQVIQVNLKFGDNGGTKTVSVFGQESADALISSLSDLADNNLTGVN